VKQQAMQFSLSYKLFLFEPIRDATYTVQFAIVLMVLYSSKVGLVFCITFYQLMSWDEV